MGAKGSFAEGLGDPALPALGRTRKWFGLSPEAVRCAFPKERKTRADRVFFRFGPLNPTTLREKENV